MTIDENETYRLFKIMNRPHCNLTEDGELYLEWRIGGRTLNISVPGNGDKPYFCRQDKDSPNIEIEDINGTNFTPYDLFNWLSGYERKT